MPKPGTTVIPRNGLNGNSSLESVADEPQAKEKINLIPTIPIEAKWQVIGIQDGNIDGDTDEEQIIILSDQSDREQDHIEIRISDFDRTTNSYILAWKGKVSSITPDSLSLTINESAQPGFFELYLLGYTKEGFHSIDVFYPISGDVPDFISIYSHEVKGTIELSYPQIAGSSLSDDYGTKVRVSPDLIITESDSESENSLDSIISTLKLSHNPPRYKVISTKRIEVSKEQEEKLLELINGSLDNFEQTLSDYWYRVEGDSDSIRMINIDKERKTIEFLTKSTLESYTWTSSHKSSYAPRLYLYSSSDHISSVRKELIVNMSEYDGCQISVFDNGKQHLNNSWSGKYKRMTDSMKSLLIQDTYRKINTKEFDLRGKYKNASGEEIIFENNSFTITQGELEKQGYFTMFILDGLQLIEFVYFDERGIKGNTEFYRFQYSEIDDREHRIRSFIIDPGNLNVRGFSPSEERGQRYEQIELRDTSSEPGAE